jgi:hypothetical protein
MSQSDAINSIVFQKGADSFPRNPDPHGVDAPVDRNDILSTLSRFGLPGVTITTSLPKNEGKFVPARSTHEYNEDKSKDPEIIRIIQNNDTSKN